MLSFTKSMITAALILLLASPLKWIEAQASNL